MAVYFIIFKPWELFVLSPLSSVVNDTVTIEAFPVDVVIVDAVDGPSLPVRKSSRTLAFSFSVKDPPLSSSMKVKVFISSEIKKGDRTS